MGAWGNHGLAVLLVASTSAMLSFAVQELSDWQSGILTHYGGRQDGLNPSEPSFGSKEGSCGYGMIPKDRWPFFSVAALSPNNSFYQQGPLNGCGQCFQIQCVSGMDQYHADACYKDSKGVPKSILVVISDECPECADYHIDVQSLSFAKLVDPDLGRIKINYRRIECTPPEDIKVSVMDFAGSNGWLRLAIDEAGGRGAVKQVYVKTSGAEDWIAMDRTWGATWELPQAPSPPLDFKIVTDDGQDVVATEVIMQNSGIRQGAFAPRVKFSTGVQATITDPAVQLVQAASGLDGSSDPMLATSDTPGNENSLAANVSGAAAAANATNPPPATDASSPAPPAPSLPALSPEVGDPADECINVLPPGIYTCEEQKERGRCDMEYMIQGGFCSATCGRCFRDVPLVQSFSSAASMPTTQSSGTTVADTSSCYEIAGRKLLRQQQG